MGVATAVAVGGLAISAASTTMSFMNAAEQKSKQRAAEAAAAAAMAEARRKLQINYTDEMAVKKEPYELQREALLSAGAQAIQAGQESERGAVATAGKVQMAQNEAQAGIRTEMGKEMTDIQNKQIAEQSRLRDLGVQMDLGEVEGQQAMARDAEQQAAADNQAGWQGVMSTAQQGLGMVNLFPKSGAPASAQKAAAPAPANPLPGTAQSYGPMGTNWAPMSSYQTQTAPAFGPQLPAQPPLPGTYNGPMGINWSGVGSDRKLKKNITKIGESPSGLNIYSFEYIDKTQFGEGVFQGAMSDEVPQNAVIKGSDGFDRVDYSLLDIEFKKI